MPVTMPTTDQQPPEDRVTTQLRIERPLWDRTKEMARRKRMSTNSYVCAAVERTLAEDERALERA